MSKELLIANFETKRFLVLQAYRADPESVSKALAYAYNKRIAPVEHKAVAKEAYGVDPYDSIYVADEAFVKSIAKYIDEKWRAEDFDAVMFSRLEDHFGGYKANRMELAYVLRYLRLCGLFDDKFFAAVMKSAPVEAHSIMEDYTPDDVELE